MKKYGELSKNIIDPKSSVTCQVKISSTMHGLHWYMHEHDDDINDPSCPHCHALEKHWKLDIYTGYMYSYPNRVCEGKISKAEMRNMWKQKGFLELVIKERLWYEENCHKVNPDRYPELPKLPVMIKHKKVILRITKKWINNNIKNGFISDVNYK